MKLNRLHIPDYYILKDFEINFQNKLSLIIGENGSGKSSLIEVLAYIFGHLHKYFVLNDKTAVFIDGYEIEYEISYNNSVHSVFIKSKYVDQISNTFKPTIKIDGTSLSLSQIDKIYGGMKHLLPTKVILYYAGITTHLSELNEHFRKKYRSRLIQKGNNYSLQPLVLPNDNPFCYIQSEYLPLIVLSLLLDEEKSNILLSEKLGIDLDSIDVVITCKEPAWHRERKKDIEQEAEKHPWGIEGTVSKEIFDSLVQNCIAQDYNDEHAELKLEFLGSIMINDVFADFESTPETAFSLLDVLLCSDLIKSIDISWKKDGNTIFLDRLSEGQKQLLMTWGASFIWNQDNLLFLFDEPDVSLHPKWQREIISDLDKSMVNSCAVISTHSPIMLSNASNSDAYIIDKGKLAKNTPKFFGKDNNTILFEIMGVTKRIDSVSKRIDELFSAIENDDIELSESLYTELSDLLGSDDNDLVRARMEIDYLKDDSF